jgi:Icc-related predicted phosphoesterase
MTHGPPLGVGDVNHRGDAWGCAELLASVRKRVRPKWHVFGHIHESHGVFSDGVTTFVNAAVLNQMLLPLQASATVGRTMLRINTTD